MIIIPNSRWYGGQFRRLILASLTACAAAHCERRVSFRSDSNCGSEPPGNQCSPIAIRLQEVQSWSEP